VSLGGGGWSEEGERRKGGKKREGKGKGKWREAFGSQSQNCADIFGACCCAWSQKYCMYVSDIYVVC